MPEFHDSGLRFDAPIWGEENRAPAALHIQTIPCAEAGYVAVKQSAPELAHLTSALIDELSAEHLRRVIKTILGCHHPKQPHCNIDTNRLAPNDKPAVANDAEVKRSPFAPIGKGRDERCLYRAERLGRVDLPQGDELFAANQAKVGAIRPAGNQHLATLKVNVFLDIEAQRPGE